jgi:uncharacterized delta-60 repeat protein
MLEPWQVVSRAARPFSLAALLGLSLPLAASPTLDPAFGTNGTALHVFPYDGTRCGSGVNAVTSVIAMRNGNTFADGDFVSDHTGIKCFPIYGYALAQYNRNGEPDISFGTQGTGPSNKNGKLLQRDNQLIGAGSTGLFRLNLDGSPEQGFVTDGAKGLDWFALATWTQLAQQVDGKIVVAGMSNASLAIVRFAADGTLDMTFNRSGAVLAPVPPDVTEYFGGLALQSDGRIVLVSSSVFHAGAETQFTGISIARFESAGTPDLSFGSGGKVIATASDALGLYGNYLHSTEWPARHLWARKPAHHSKYRVQRVAAWIHAQRRA